MAFDPDKFLATLPPDQPTDQAPAATKPAFDPDAFLKTIGESDGTITVPEATTYVSDKNIVVGHSADMSHDQVAQKISQTIYGEPKTISFQDAPPADASISTPFHEGLFHDNPKLLANALPPKPPEKEQTIKTDAAFKPAPDLNLFDLPTPPTFLAKEETKAAVRGILDNGAAAINVAVRWIGEATQHDNFSPEPEFLREAGKQAAELGKTGYDYWQARKENGIEAPDAEMMRGAFLSNPSFTRAAASLTENFAPLFAATALSGGMDIPLAGPAALGFLGAAEQYEGSREAGASVARASTVAGGRGIFDTLAMSLPVGKVLKGAGVAKSVGIFALTGQGQYAGDYIASVLGRTKKFTMQDYTIGALENLLFTAASGGAISFAMRMRGAMMDAWNQELHKDGVPASAIDGFRQELVDELIAEKEKIEKKIIQQYSKNGVPKLKPSEVVSTITDEQGNKIEITHKEVVDRAKADLAQKIEEWNRDIDDPVGDYIKKHKLKMEPAVGGQIPEKGEYERLPEDVRWNDFSDRLKSKYKPKTASELATYINENPKEFGLPDGTELDINDIYKHDFAERKLKPKIDYYTALHDLEGEASGGSTEFNYGANVPEEQNVAAEQRAEFGETEKSPHDNVIARYERLVKQAADQGLNPLQASKWAKEQMRTNPEAGLPESKPKQGEFGAEGGVEGFGQGRKGEHSLFERPLEPYGKSKLEDFLTKMSERMRKYTPTTEKNKYFKNEESFNIREGATDKKTGKNLMEEVVGRMNEIRAMSYEAARQNRRLVRDEDMQRAMVWNAEADGNMDTLVEALHDPRFADEEKYIQQAMNLPEKALEAIREGARFYKEAGQVAKEIGTIREERENYRQARMYEPTPPEKFVKTEAKTGLHLGTGHAQHRVYENMFEAVRNGEKLKKGIGYADLMESYGYDFANVNAARQMANAAVENGTMAWKKEKPEGWKQVGTLEKRVPIKDENGEAVIGEDGNQVVSVSKLYAPEGIANALRPLTDPNAITPDSIWGKVLKYQQLAKTGKLSFGLFHEYSEAVVAMNQGNFKALMTLPGMQKAFDSSEYQFLEQHNARLGLVTEATHGNIDIMKRMVTDNPDLYSKIVNLPGVKQMLEAGDAHSQFLFGNVIRYIKNMDMSTKEADFIGRHPEMTDAEYEKAFRGIAKEVNAAYGGLNWELMGVTKTNLSLMRLIMLAPDWTISNFAILKYAVSDWGETATAGYAARRHIANATLRGILLTEAMNRMTTGHFTDKNKKGHGLEVELATNVYSSWFRGPGGDILKAFSMTRESGAPGLARFAQGKIGPFAGTVAGALYNITYSGKPVATRKEGALMGTYDFLKFVILNPLPVPYGIENFFQYLQDRDKTMAGGAAVLTSAARYSKDFRKKSGASNFKP